MTIDFPFVLTAVFFLVLLVIASWGSKRTRNTSDFFLGGRTLGPWILAISYGTAYFSAVVFIGFAGKFGWLCGFGGLWVGLMNALIGGALAWLVLGRATRRMTRNLGAMTMPEFFSARYNTNGMKITTAIIIFVFLLPYSASVFAGLGYLFEKVFHLPIPIAITIITLVTGFYVIFGGYKAAARIDFLQGIIMFVGAVLMVWFIVKKFGAPAETIQAAQDAWKQRVAQALSENTGAVQNAYDAVKPIPGYLLASVVFMTSFAAWGLPQMVHKYYAIKDESQIVRGAVITTIFALVVGCGAYFCGGLTHLLPMDQLNIAVVDGKVDTNALVPLLLIYALPKPLLAVILLLVLSASMSTLSSLVLVSSSAMSIDLYKGYLAPKRSEKHYLVVMRGLSGLFILLSWWIALYNPSWIVALMSLAWGAVAGAFLSPYLYGLFWKGTTKLGAYAGMWAGLLLANGIYFSLYFARGSAMANAYAPLAATVAIIVPFFVVPPVSWMTPKVAPETVAKAFAPADWESEESKTA